jgi:hypothetical protein
MSPTNTSKARSKELQSVEVFLPENQEIKNLRSIKPFIGSLLPSLEVELRPTIGELIEEEHKEAVASSLALARVKDPTRPEQDLQPIYGELDYERRVLDGEARAGGILYDGRILEDIFSRILKPSVHRASIVLTDRLVSTFSRDDLRHHLRTIVCGFPSIVSLPGIVEAPAKPREYYLMKQKLEIQGAGELQIERLKSSFKGRFIDYGDRRTIEVVKGLVLQGVMFHLTLEPFCDKRDCRLFNAHWQEDLVRSQITSAKLCKDHTRQLKSLSSHPSIAW